MSSESAHLLRSRGTTKRSSPTYCQNTGEELSTAKSIANKHSLEITLSKWSIGWKTLTSMYLSYFLALTLAIVHLFLFRYLDGKLASDDSLCAGFLDCVSRKAISQTYTSTAAILLSNAFAIAIKISLALAFTQHLWRVLRKSALKVQTIELLFNMRSNIFKMFSLSVIQASWILILIAIVIYLVPIAISFPAGALTIKTTSPLVTALAVVPTLNVSSIGNKTISMLESYLAIFEDYSFLSNSTRSTPVVETLYYVNLFQPIQSLNKLAATIGLSGEPLGIRSPCGPNCSYTFQFEGPSLKCSKTTAKVILPPSGNTTIFSALWSPFDLMWQENPVSIFSNAFLNISTSNMPTFHNKSESTSVSSLSCVPFRSLYTASNSYTNNIQTLNYTTKPLARLLNTGWLPNSSLAVNWTTFWRTDNTWYRDGQLMGIIVGMASVINGSCLSQSISTGQGDSFYWASASLSCSGIGGPLVPYTRLSDDFHEYIRDSEPVDENFGSPVSFTVTEEILNSFLANLTLSIIVAINAWNQTINVTQFLSQSVYTFSRPTNLILPYFLSLLVTLPFLIIGTFALLENGVPATDGGFIQILSTTTGSRRLQQAAAGHCLGGDTDGSLLKPFTNLEVQYGELNDRNVRVGGITIRRAGFGTKDEVVPLIKDENYGIVTKI